MPAYPSTLSIVLAAAASAACHSALDAVPASAVRDWLAKFGATHDGFDLRMWLHSAVLGALSAATFAYEMSYADVIEPQRSFQCLPPATVLGWVLPAAELGYALHDLRDALRMGNASFILHGVFVGGFLALLFWLRVAHHATPGFAVHLSSVFLNLRRVDFGPRGNRAVDVGFVVSFFVLRGLLLPAVVGSFLWAGFGASAAERAAWGACMLGGRVLYVAAAGGGLLTALNVYWGWQIVLKMRSKWRDADGIGSDAAEGHYHHSKTS